MTAIRWINKTALMLLQAESLAEHGGLEGIRDESLLDSALARPLNLNMYEDETDPARLAAAYAVGIVRNHPFADGNKRAAFLALGLFLGLNGLRLTASKADAARTIWSLAPGDVSEEQLATWIAENSQRR
jgi:death-on-curing protein